MKNVKNNNFELWLSRMTLLCNRSAIYNIRNVTYSFNPNLDEKILEEGRINKPINNNIKNVFTNRNLKIKPNL
jgi:hypothetical protein